MLAFSTGAKKIREIKEAFTIMKGNHEESCCCLRKLNRESGGLGPVVCPTAEAGRSWSSEDLPCPLIRHFRGDPAYCGQALLD